MIDFTFLYNEHKIIWLNDLQEIFMSNFDRTNRTKLITLDRPGVSIDADWIQRSIYWVQYNHALQESSIHSYDLNIGNEQPVTVRKLATVQGKIHKFQLSPYAK